MSSEHCLLQWIPEIVGDQVVTTIIRLANVSYMKEHRSYNSEKQTLMIMHHHIATCRSQLPASTTSYYQVSSLRIQYRKMSFESEGDPLRRSSTEHYDIIGVDLDWFLILGSASSIFFGFLLKIALNPPSDFTLLDKTNLLGALYAMAVSTAMFVTPVIYHTSIYRKFNADIFVFKTKQYVKIGIICVMLAMYLSLALVLDSKLPILAAYSLASFPFIFVFFRFYKDTRK